MLTQRRTVLTPAANGGTPCPSLTEQISCTTAGCPAPPPPGPVLPPHLAGARIIFSSVGSPSNFMGPDGSVSVNNDIELDNDCQTEDRCNFRFIPSKFGTAASPLYFVESPYRPGIYWKVDSGAANERLEFGSCNPDVDEKTCQWSVVDVNNSNYQFRSAARDRLFVQADASPSGSLVRIQPGGTSDLSRWRLVTKQ